MLEAHEKLLAAIMRCAVMDFQKGAKKRRIGKSLTKEERNNYVSAKEFLFDGDDVPLFWEHLRIKIKTRELKYNPKMSVVETYETPRTNRQTVTAEAG